MNYPQLRRTELWVAFTASTVLGGLFSWLAISKGLPFLWCFAGLFLVLMPFTAWKAVRPDGVFESEERRFGAFTKQHPILSLLLILGTMAGLLLSIGSMAPRILETLTK